VFTYGVDFVVIKLVVLLAEVDVVVVAVVIFTVEVDLVVVFLTSGDVDGEVVVTLAAVKLMVDVAEDTAVLLLVVDAPSSSSFFDVALSVVDDDVVLESVEKEVVLTPGVGFLVL